MHIAHATAEDVIVSAPVSRGARLMRNVAAMRHRPGSPSPDATAAEISHLGVLRAVDALVAAALLEVFASRDDLAMPARRQVALARLMQEALIADFRAGNTNALDAMWARLHGEETS